jgi:hypothetical protein
VCEISLSLYRGGGRERREREREREIFRVMPPVNRIIWLLPFQFECFVFFSLAKLLWLESPVLCCVEVEKAGILVLLLILEKNFQSFAIKYDVSIGFFM